ncbi:MAG: GNAT family N-acetyltransferase [Planctomycetota bacterium]|nr:MAG: GNAT family N-acetyltransferase [Planctomycetota bacterium]
MLSFEVYYARQGLPDEERMKELEVLAAADPDKNLLAFADLYPPHAAHTDFILVREKDKTIGAVIIYRGFSFPSVTVISSDQSLEPLLLSEVIEDIEGDFVTICPPRQEGLYGIQGEIISRRPEYQMIREGAPPEPEGPARRVMREGLAELREFYSIIEFAFWSDVIFESGPYMWVREDEKVVAAGGVHFMTKDTAQLGGVMTAPDYRRRGYARSITTHLLAALSEHVDKVSLYTPVDNKAAHALYRSLGFETVADRLMLMVRPVPFS